MLMKVRHSWKNEDKAEFLIRIGSLLEQGYTIPESLELFLKYEKENLKPLLLSLLQELQKGRSFSHALSMLQLPGNIISFVSFAEHYGNLARGLLDGGQLLKNTEVNKRKLKKLISYPLFLLWILITFIIIMNQFLFPQFQLLFSTINIELPVITKVFLFIIEKIPFIFSVVLIISSCTLAYYLIVIQKKNVEWKARAVTKIPLIGEYYQTLITYFFAINLSCLIKNGLAIYDALAIFEEEKRLGYISSEAKRLISRLEAGEPLQSVLLKDTLFLKGLAYIVDHGHSNGRLDEELEHYSSWLLLEFEEKTKKVFMILQPALFLGIGIIVLFMFAAVLLPIFTLINGL
jgi:competence protein ComGB